MMLFAIIGANTGNASPTLEAVRGTRDDAKQALKKIANEITDQLKAEYAYEGEADRVRCIIGEDDACVIDEREDMEYDFVLVEVPTSPEGSAYARKMWA